MPSSYGSGAWGAGAYSYVPEPVSPWVPSPPCPPVVWFPSPPCDASALGEDDG